VKKFLQQGMPGAQAIIHEVCYVTKAHSLHACTSSQGWIPDTIGFDRTQLTESLRDSFDL
jgi:hypothetical protein